MIFTLVDFLLGDFVIALLKFSAKGDKHDLEVCLHSQRRLLLNERICSQIKVFP